VLPDSPLTDGRVLLRPWQLEDADWYVRAARDPEILRWTNERPDLTAEQVREAIAAMHATRGHAGMLVTAAATGERLGNAGLAPGDPGVGRIAYWVAAEARGRGVATRSVRLLVEHAWRLGLRRVELWAHVDNQASQRVAERAGLRRDRVQRGLVTSKGAWDVVWYGLDRPSPERDADAYFTA
jgi:RimJ/RimL family protein N-acetyltransferase